MKQPPPANSAGRRETAADIERAAAAWVARVDRGGLSAADEDALSQWISADPRRSGAYARALAVNHHLDRTTALGDGFPVHLGQRGQRPRRHLLAIAASVAMIFATAGGLFAYRDVLERPLQPAIETTKDHVRLVTLAEGSSMTLNTLTELRPEMTPKLRRVDLIQGEALFHVAKDPARPFVVFAGGLNVKAVGTSFSVRRISQEAISVLVTEGVVEVSRSRTILGRVHAGISFTADMASTPVITQLNAVQLASALSWKDGRIDLQGLTLDQAASEFRRYSDVPIRIDDPALGKLHVTGGYSATDSDGFAEAAALSLGLRTQRRKDGIHIFKN